MLTIRCLNEYPHIINIINNYLDPIFIKRTMELAFIKNSDYHKKINYLFKHNIKIKYALDYAKFPERTMPFLYELSKIIPQDEAFDILMIIPFHNYKLNKISNYSNEEQLIKLLNYNYTWAYLLFKKNISINIIKELLHKFYDFYFFEICFINKTKNDFNESFKLIVKDLNDTFKYKINFYKLRQYKIPHFIAYNLSRLNDNYIDKIIDIAKYGYNDCLLLSHVCFFDEKQIDFLKLCRYGYVYYEDFNKFKNNIFEKALSGNIIDETLNYDLLVSPNKKIKTN